MAEENKQQTPPYTTYKSFTNLIIDFREEGTPDHVTRSVVKGSNSGKAMMSATLKYLKLVDSESVPTESFKQLIDSVDNYKELLSSLLHSSYPFLFDGSIDLSNTTTEKVADKFKLAGARGSTISKCMVFFLAAAKDAEINISSRVKAQAPARSNNGSKKQKNKSSQDNDTSDANSGDKPGSGADIHEGMEQITVPLRDMNDGVIYFPPNLETAEARKAVKMAIFILNNFYELEEE
ncbi:MAG: DUF5343 domain-containing protein [Methylococcales bacterium]